MKNLTYIPLFFVLIFLLIGCKSTNEKNLVLKQSSKESSQVKELVIESTEKKLQFDKFLGDWRGIKEDSQYLLSITEGSKGMLNFVLKDGENEQNYENYQVQKYDESSLYLLNDDQTFFIGISIENDELTWAYGVYTQSNTAEGMSRPIKFSKTNT